MRYAKRWEMPEVTFYEVEDHGFPAHKDRPLYAYGKPGETNDHGIPKTAELFTSLDRAMVSWVAEKYTGARGAGGTGVGTAADWFMRMIGADTLVQPDYVTSRKALTEALSASEGERGPLYLKSRRVADELEARGVVLAVMNHGR